MVQRLQAPCPRDASTQLSFPSTHDDLCPTCAQPAKMLDLGQFDLGFFDLSQFDSGQFDLGQFLVAQTFLNCVVWCVVLCVCGVCCVCVLWCCGVSVWCVGGVCVQDFRGCVQDLLPSSVGPPPPDRPKFRAFVPLPPQFSFILPSLWGSSRGILVVCVGGDPQMCTSGLSKRAHFRAPTTKIPREDPKRGRKKERKLWGERGKKARNFGPPPFWAPPFRSPPFGALFLPTLGGGRGEGEDWPKSKKTL